MAAAAPRILYRNLVLGAGVALVPSSEEAAHPRTALLTHHTTDRWRTKTGWTVGVWNNKINFNRGGAKTATVATGTYATAALLAAAIVAALEAADPTPVWACAYTANKFVISSDLAFTLLFGTGADVFKSIAGCIGFANTDTGSATTQTGGAVSYQSRHMMAFDLGSAQAYTAGALIGFNGSGGTYRLQGDPIVDLSIEGFNYGPAIGFVDKTLTGGATMRQLYFTTETTRYVRLLIENTANTEAYGEASVFFVGPFLDLAGFEPEVVDVTDDLSEVHRAVGGAHFTTVRAQPRIWELSLINITAAAKADLWAFEQFVGLARGFFFNFDSADPTDMRYVRKLDPLRFEAQRTSPPTWHARVRFEEVLG